VGETTTTMKCDVNSCDKEATVLVTFSTDKQWPYCDFHGKRVGTKFVKPQGKKPYWMKLEDQLKYKILKRKVDPS
jgi:hypothetical protein